MKEEHKNKVNSIIHKLGETLDTLKDILADEYNACEEITNETDKKEQGHKASMLDDIIKDFDNGILDLEDLINR